MLESSRIFSAFQEQGVGFFTGVPDSLLKDFCAYVTDHAPKTNHVIAANEGSAMATAAGYHLATGGMALVYMQNSGVGNMVNPLLSLADPEVYGLPMVVLIGWRGEPGVHDEPQHVKQGRVMLALLDAMETPYRALAATEAEALDAVAWAVRTARERQSPVALVVRKGTFAAYKLQRDDSIHHPIAREEAMEVLAEALAPDDIVVSTTGMISRELFEVRQRRGERIGRDFLTVGSMGHASAIAFGIALQRTDRQVICFDGDGAMLMHLGAVAVLGQAAPANFKHIVINNGSHDSVGGQPTVGFKVNLGEVARACGYKVLPAIRDPAALRDAASRLRETEGPALLEVLVRRGSRKDLGRPTSTPRENKRAFMRFVASGE